MNKFRKYLSYLILLSLAFFAYLGAFSRIKIEKSISPDRKLLGQWVIGPFSQVPRVQKALHAKLSTLNVPLGAWTGTYIDDPKTTPSESLRWFYGAELLVDDTSNQPWKGKDIVPLHLPPTPILRTTFPLNPRFVPFSIILGVQRVYRALEKYSLDTGILHGPVTEVYDMKNKRIIYEAYLEPVYTLEEHVGGKRKITRKSKDEL